MLGLPSLAFPPLFFYTSQYIYIAPPTPWAALGPTHCAYGLELGPAPSTTYHLAQAIAFPLSIKVNKQFLTLLKYLRGP